MSYEFKLRSVSQLIYAVMHRTLSPEELHKEMTWVGSPVARTLKMGSGIRRVHMMNAWESLASSCTDNAWQDFDGVWHDTVPSELQRWFMIQRSMLAFLHEHDKCIRMDALMKLSIEEIIEEIPHEVTCRVRVGTEQGAPGSFTLYGPNQVYVNAENRSQNPFPKEWVWESTITTVRDEFGPAKRVGAEANPALREVVEWLTSEGTYRGNVKAKICELLA